MVPLDELAPFAGATMRAEADSATLSADRGTARVYAGRSLVPIEGRQVLLSAPVRAGGDHWFVPLDFISKVLPVISGQKLAYREQERLLVLGEAFPRLSVRALSYPSYTRVVVEASTSVPFQVNQVGSQIQVLIRAPYVDTDFLGQEVKDGVVDRLDLDRAGEEYMLTVGLGERFGTLKAFELESPKRMVLDLFRSRVPTEAVGGAAVAQPEPEGRDEPRSPPTTEPSSPQPEGGDLRIITLDPGHGGSETGATGPTGLQEKEVTLAIARRLRTLLESRLGVRVLFTRDSDQDLSLDERTAIANSNKSDIFISIHVNASPRSNARGSEVYFLAYEASDEDARRVAAAENASAGPGGARMNRDLQFILWDMAQAAYLNESSVLAEMLQEELLAHAGERNNRGIKQAPFRVLMGAGMPAVLVEVGFITNPDEEQLMQAPGHQEELAQAVLRGVLRYKDRFERKLGMRTPRPQS